MEELGFQLLDREMELSCREVHWEVLDLCAPL
jgi:hypothetical protein